MSTLSDRTTQSFASRTSTKTPSDGHSLDSFLSTYTSEDNNSFQELIESADKKLRQKFSVLYNAEDETALAIANSLNVPSIEQQFEPIEGQKSVSLCEGSLFCVQRMTVLLSVAVGNVEV